MGDHGSTSPGEIETGTAGRACDACHKKKTKCDMQQPICGLCRRTNKECHFPSTRKRPSRQEPSARAKLQKVNGHLDRLVELLESNPNIEQESLREILGAKGISSLPKSSSHSSPTIHESSGDCHSNVSPRCDSTVHINSDASSESPVFPVSRELANHLIDLYLDKIQPWLPLFHKPTFLEWCASHLLPGPNSLAKVTAHEAVLFNSVFALAARFSDHLTLIGLPAKERGHKFMKATEHYFKVVRDLEEFDLTYLKGCVLLAYYHYSCGHSKRGWYLSHMCIRGCYELGLHQIDEGDDDEPVNEDESWIQKESVRRTFWVEKESLRRTFWAIFEIDSFGSIVKRKPFAIDWRHVQVRMPVSDEAWFAGRKVESPKFIPGPECWKTLVGSPNQDERAWALLSKVIVCHVFDLMLFKEGITIEQKETVETNMSCFRLAMPESIQLTNPAWCAADKPVAGKNWVMATHLYLAVAAFMLNRMPIVGQPPSPQEEDEAKSVRAYKTRVAELNEILKRWPADAIQYAHPCLGCTILTYDESLVNTLPPSMSVGAYRDMSSLILTKIAERWKLGAVLIRVRDLAYNYQASDEAARVELIRQYPVYFHRELLKLKKPIVEEAQRIWTPGGKSPSLSSITTHRSIDQSTSPEQMIPPSNYQPQQQSLSSSPASLMQQNPYQMDTTDLNYDALGNTYSNYQNFNSFCAPAQAPEDIDAIFSGFIQEPWWQDLGSLNFVV